MRKSFSDMSNRALRTYLRLSAVDNILYFLAAMATFTFVIAFITDGKSLALSSVSIAALSAGGLIAFMNTRMKDEEPLLGKYALALNAALTTSFLTDALNKDGHVRAFVKEVSRAAYGNDTGQPTVAALMLTMAVLGFLSMYLYRVSFLNRELQKNYKEWGTREVFDTNAGSITALADRELTRLLPDTTPVIPAEIVEKAKELLAQKGHPETLVSVDDTVTYAKCYCMSGEPEKGLKLLEEHVAANPDNAALSLHAGMTLLLFGGEKDRAERYRKAEEHLVRHCSSKSARFIVLKALGYCHTMRAITGTFSTVEEKQALLVRAVESTHSYIDLLRQYGGSQPVDKGALVTLASAMVLLKKPDAEVLEVLRKAVEAGAGKELVQRLSEKDGDDRLTEFEHLSAEIMGIFREVAKLPALPPPPDPATTPPPTSG